MDGYRDLYRVPVSAGYYARYPSAYGVEGRSPYVITAADPLLFAYSRAAALDHYAGYGTPVAYEPELLPLPQHSFPIQFSSPRRRSDPKRRPAKHNSGKGRPAHAEILAPKKKLFKKTQKDFPVERVSFKGNKQKRGLERKLSLRDQKNAGKAKELSAAETLVKETQELHKLFRTGVDSSTGKKNLVKVTVKQAGGTPGKKNIENKAARQQKRKAEEEKKGEAPSSQKKRKGKKRSRKDRKKEAKEDGKLAETPKAMKADPVALTEEEKKERDLSLELQHGACKGVAEFLGIPEKSAEPEPEPEPEPEKSEPAQAADNKLPGETTAEAPMKLESSPAQEKVEEAPKLPTTLTPEEEKALEEKGYNFFSKMFEENSDLCKLYLDKKDAGTFECLVCWSVDPETSKRFNNLTSLVMHTSMRKQKRPEHRGYGKAICDILGWESLRGANNRPAKQVKDGSESTKKVEVEKVSAGEVQENKQQEEDKHEEEEEIKQEGTSDL